jgi:hypothetical protein
MGRPKGSKNKPKNTLVLKDTTGAKTLVVFPEQKRRGRPKGSKNKPKEKGATISFLPPVINAELPGVVNDIYSVRCQVSRLGADLYSTHPDHLIGKWESYHTAMDVRNLVVNLCTEAVKIIRERAVKK